MRTTIPCGNPLGYHLSGKNLSLTTDTFAYNAQRHHPRTAGTAAVSFDFYQGRARRIRDQLLASLDFDSLLKISQVAKTGDGSSGALLAPVIFLFDIEFDKCVDGNARPSWYRRICFHSARLSIADML